MDYLYEKNSLFGFHHSELSGLLFSIFDRHCDAAIRFGISSYDHFVFYFLY